MIITSGSCVLLRLLWPLKSGETVPFYMHTHSSSFSRQAESLYFITGDVEKIT